ncbi:MAG: GNAT family N-acetyltransferase [Candidatus Thorarchaeota archaeon]|nr:GNAT family N-acetyltransferase [Candidatus Thorarchaeota archaeon]
MDSVKDEDLELLLAWRSHPDVYRYFHAQSSPLHWDEHYKFWTTRKDRLDWIISVDDGIRKRKVGSVNVSHLSSPAPEIGIFIGEVTLMGHGVGKRSLKLVLLYLKSQGYLRATARIAEGNIPSQRLFGSLGFVRKEKIPDADAYLYELVF